MQLFITHYTQTDNHITITEERVVRQLSTVLRAKKGDEVTLQRDGKRVLCALTNIGKKEIEAEVLKEESITHSESSKYLAVALPNKFEKMELIVQKATEIGVEHLVFFPAKHSLLKEISDAKMERLEKISLEASEQSWGIKKLNIQFEKSIFNFCDGKKVFVAHQDGKKIKSDDTHSDSSKGNIVHINSSDALILLVGPEGGRHSDEEKMFEDLYAEKISFGETILRTETAAILAARLLV